MRDVTTAWPTDIRLARCYSTYGAVISNKSNRYDAVCKSGCKNWLIIQSLIKLSQQSLMPHMFTLLSSILASLWKYSLIAS